MKKNESREVRQLRLFKKIIEIVDYVLGWTPASIEMVDARERLKGRMARVFSS